MQNSGVTLRAESQHFIGVHDDNPCVASIPCFGFIEEIWELNYVKYIVCVFKCKWVDSNTGVWTDDVGFTFVDLKKLAYPNDPFIMAEQAKQVFMFKTYVMKGDQWFYMGKQLVLMLKMMIHTLILMLVLCPHKCRLTLPEKKKLTTFMLIVMITMKEN